jgi:hypothetical protein
LDITTLSLAVDSTQVNSAAAALAKMAGEGYKAETVVAKLANTATLQGKALNAGIVRGAAEAAQSIKGLTGATSALASAQDFSKTTASLHAAASEAATATGAVRAFGAALAATAAASASVSFQAPKTPTVAQIIAAPVSATVRSESTAVVDSKPITTASNALDKMADQAAKAEHATEKLTNAAQAQGRVLGAGVAPNASKAASSIQELATASNALGTAPAIAATAAALGTTAAQANTATAAINNLNAAASKGGGVTQAGATATTGSSPVTGAAAAATSAFAAAAGQAAKQSTALGQANKLTSFQTQQLHFQLHDFFVQVISGQSPLTALVQQGSQLSGTFGGAAGAFRAVLSLLTPLRLAFGGVAAVIGTVGYAYYTGAKQSKEFADALVLSGNYAGMTAGKFDELAKKIAASGQVTVSAAQDAVLAAIQTGEIGPQTIGKAAEAIALYSQATGKAADEVAADFAKMVRSPSRFAEEINRSKNLFTAPELKSFRMMEEQGHAADAQGPILDRVIERYKELDKNVGFVERALRAAKNGFDEFWKAAVDDAGGGPETVENKLKRVEDKLRNFNPFAISSLLGGGKKALEDERSRLLKEQDSEAAKAAAAAKTGKTQKEGDEARQRLDATYRRAKPGARLKEMQERDEADFAKAEAAGKGFTDAEKRAIRQQTLKDNTDPETAQKAQAIYAERVQAFKDALDKEKEALQFHNRFQQGEYQAGRLSLQEFYDGKIADIRKNTAAEIAEIDKEKAATQQLLKSVIDPSERLKLQAQIRHYDVEKQKASTAGQHEEVLANQELNASIKALDDQVTNYRANLLQLEGDELGAARLRAQIADRNAQILAEQSRGRISDADVKKQSTLTEIANQYADMQRRAGEVAQNTARAEEAANLLAEISGKSLLETERDVYAVRQKAVEQLGILTAKAAELAAVSTDPKIKQFAADLALQYAKAADAVDPALQRLREANKELARGVADVIGNAPQNFAEAYNQQRQDAQKDLQAQRDEHDKKISELEGYLSKAQDKEDKARLRARIKEEQAAKAKVSAESKAKSALKAFDDAVLAPIGRQALATVNKLFITDPLQKYLENQLKSLTEGDGLLAKSFKDTLGIKDPKNDALLAQAAAANASATALDALTAAAKAAANAVQPTAPSVSRTTGDTPDLRTPGDFARFDRSQEPASTDAAKEATDTQRASADSTAAFGKTTLTAASDVARLAQSAGAGGDALARLPGIVSLFQMIVAATSAKSAGSSLSGLASLFGSGSSAGGGSAAADAVTSYYFHSGGVVSASAGGRSMPSALFAGATRYHSGGIAGEQPDSERAAAISAVLKAGEVPAILMRDEEVLRRDDPRHRFNLAADVFAKIMTGEKNWREPATAKAGKQVQNNSVASLLQNITGNTKRGGENSASVLAGLLERLGVGKEREPAIAQALHVAGAREYGGDVSAGSLYRVNERGPELLTVSGKQYLMMGNQSGKVDPGTGHGKGGNTYHLQVNVTPPPGATRETASQFGAAAGRQIQHAMRRNT